MKVWQKQTVRWRKNGKNVPKGTKGSRKAVLLSKRFYGTLRLANGKRKQIPLTEDVKTSESLLRRLQSDEDRKSVLGITEADEKRTRNVLDALTEYVAFLKAKGNTDDHVLLKEQRLRKLFSAMKTKTLADLDAGRVLRTLDDWRKTLSVQTLSHYIACAKSFSRWLVHERQLPSDPFIGLQKMNAQTDRRRVRRAFTDDELKRLLEASSPESVGKFWFREIPKCVE